MSDCRLASPGVARGVSLRKLSQWLARSAILVAGAVARLPAQESKVKVEIQHPDGQRAAVTVALGQLPG